MCKIHQKWRFTWSSYQIRISWTSLTAFQICSTRNKRTLATCRIFKNYWGPILWLKLKHPCFPSMVSVKRNGPISISQCFRSNKLLSWLTEWSLNYSYWSIYLLDTITASIQIFNVIPSFHILCLHQWPVICTTAQ